MKSFIVHVFLLHVIACGIIDSPEVWPPEPKPCAAEEVWKKCVSSICAETTCLEPILPTICATDCTYDCFCKDGFFRNANRTCVTKDMCTY